MSTNEKSGAKPTGSSDKSANTANKGDVSQATMTNAERKFMKSEKYRRQQQQKFIRKVSIISAIAVVVIVAITIGVNAAMKSSYGHIMTLDGKKVSIEEFDLLYVLYGSKPDALEVLKENLVIEKAATERGLTLSSDELATAKSEVSGIKEYIQLLGGKVPIIKDERFAEILGIGTLYTKLTDLIDEDLEIDEEAFEEAFEEYLETGKQYYIDTQMKYIIAETDYDAAVAREMLITSLESDPEFDVDSIIKEYSTAYSEENGIELIELGSLGLDQNNVNAILELEVGGVSEIIEFGENVFVFFIVDQITIPEEDEVRENYSQEYRNAQIDSIFNEQLQEWISETDIVVNQKAYDRVK